MGTKKFYIVISYFIDQASSPWPPLPPLFSLTNITKTINRNQSRKFSEWKQVHVWMEPPKTKGMIPQYFHTIPISCAILPTMHTKTLCMHLAYSICIDEQGTQLCLLHSLTHKRQATSAMFSSNKISQHNLNSNIPHRPSIAHALHSFWIQSRQTISAMLSIATTLQQVTT